VVLRQALPVLRFKLLFAINEEKFCSRGVDLRVSRLAVGKELQQLVDIKN